MKHAVPFVALLLFSSCTSVPKLYQPVKVEPYDDAIHLSLSKEAIQKQDDLDIVISIKNNQNKNQGIDGKE